MNGMNGIDRGLKVNALGGSLTGKYRQDLLSLAERFLDSMSNKRTNVNFRDLITGQENGQPVFDTSKPQKLKQALAVLKAMSGNTRYTSIARPLSTLVAELDAVVQDLPRAPIKETVTVKPAAPKKPLPPLHKLIYKLNIENINTHDRKTTAFTNMTGYVTTRLGKEGATTDSIVVGDLQRMNGTIQYDPRSYKIQGQEFADDYPEKECWGAGQVYNWTHMVNNKNNGNWKLDLKHFNWAGQTMDQGQIGAINQRFSGDNLNIGWQKGRRELNLGLSQKTSIEKVWELNKLSERTGKTRDISFNALFPVTPKLSLGPIIEQSSGSKKYDYTLYNPADRTAFLTPDYALNFRRNALGLKGKYVYNKQRELEFWGKAYTGTSPESQVSQQKYNGSYQIGFALKNKLQAYGMTFEQLNSRGDSTRHYSQIQLAPNVKKNLTSDHWESHKEKNISVFYQTTSKKKMAPIYKMIYTYSQKKDAADGIVNLPTGKTHTPTSVDRKSHAIGLTVTKPLTPTSQIEVGGQKTFGDRNDQAKGRSAHYGSEGGWGIGFSFIKSF
ncbi:MAG: hypothetical protein WC838_07885 [Candidatus Margulisiibacteriota bacterium]|jgi:hypothetical protein